MFVNGVCVCVNGICVYVCVNGMCVCEWYLNVHVAMCVELYIFRNIRIRCLYRYLVNVAIFKQIQYNYLGN